MSSNSPLVLDSQTKNFSAFKIGNLTIDPPLVLAPMAGVSNHAFRIICKRIGGVGLVCTEMFSAYAIKFRDPKTQTMIDWTPEESPVSVQIFGGDPETVAIGARAMQNAGADIIDLNFGCPVPKVARSGSGAALLKNINMAREILIAARDAVSVPLTVKARIGWALDDRAVFELAKTAEICGIDAITIHGRTAAQGYSGKADWSIIAEVKKRVGIPVIANGDIKNHLDAQEIIDVTNCDGIMIGRGTLGNPWIFRNINEYIKTGKVFPEESLKTRFDIALEHANILHDILGDKRAAKEMRGHLVWYIKGMPGAPKLRAQIMNTKTVAEIEDILNEARSKC